jgi:hypothetical protein
MSVQTFEGIVEQGQIKLVSDIHLPDKLKVYVVVPEMNVEKKIHVYSPRLKNPSDADYFKMEIVEENSDAKL